MTNESRQCVRCGAENLEPGQIQSTGRLYFRPKNAKFLSKDTANVGVTAVICSTCGTVELLGDLSKLHKIVD